MKLEFLGLGCLLVDWSLLNLGKSTSSLCCRLHFLHSKCSSSKISFAAEAEDVEKIDCQDPQNPLNLQILRILLWLLPSDHKIHHLIREYSLMLMIFLSFFSFCPKSEIFISKIRTLENSQKIFRFWLNISLNKPPLKSLRFREPRVFEGVDSDSRRFFLLIGRFNR